MTGKRNIVLLSTNSSLGGAAVASKRLLDQLLARGHTAQMLVMDNQSAADPRISDCGTRCSRRTAKIRERLGIFLRNGFSLKRLWAVSTAATGQPLANHPAVTAADTIIVGWINQGLLSLEELERLAESGKEIYIVMHDLWWMTGICHHPFGCRHFADRCGCGSCPLLGSRSENDLSHRIWQQKQSIYNRFPNIRFVAVSNWVKHMAAKSTLLKEKEVSVYHTPLALPDDFSVKPHEGDTVTVTMAAARLDDPNKGLDRMLQAIEDFTGESEKNVVKYRFILCGNIKDKTTAARVAGIPSVTHCPDADMEAVWDKTDIVVSLSDYETYGLTLLEGIAHGAMALTFGGDGREDIVDPTTNGMILERDSHIAPFIASLGREIVISRQRKGSRGFRQRIHRSVAPLLNQPFPFA